MSDYPPTPSFGTLGQPVPRYYEPPQNAMYEYDEGVQDGADVLSFNMTQSNNSFSHNSKIPGFSAATVASGIPPLPIYDSRGSPYSYLPEASDRFVGIPEINSSNYSDSQRPAQIISRLPVTSTQVTEEGELSEGEFEDTTVKGNESSIAASHGRIDDYESYDNRYNEPVHPRSYSGNTVHGALTVPPLTGKFNSTTCPHI
jgi:hypothetical protein